MLLNFAQYIRKISSTLLYDHLLEDSAKNVLSESVYASIETRLLSLEGVTQRVASCSEEEREFLYEIYLSGEVGVISENEEQSQVVLSTFLVYEAIGDDEKHRLFGFGDLVPIVAQYMQQYSSNTPEIQPPLFFAPILDTVILLDHIKAGRVQLKQDLDFMKSSVDSVFETTTLSQSPLSLTEKRLLLKVLIGALQDLDFIVQQGREFSLTLTGSSFAQNSTAAFEQFSQEVLHSKNIGNTQFIEALLLKGTSAELIEVTPTTAALESVTLHILQWLTHITVHEGLVSLRPDTHEYHQQEVGHLMPDFSLIIPPEIIPQSLFSILQLSDITSVDMIYHAKILREKVLETLSRGITSPEIDTLLRKWNAPESICHTVQEWAESYSQLFFDQGAFLAVRPEHESTMQAIEEVHELLEPITEFRVFKVKEGMESVLQARLIERGFDIRKPKSHAELYHVANHTPAEEGQLHTPNYTPSLEGQKEESVSKAGRYGGTPRKVTQDEIQKLVRYALLMDEQLIVYLTGEELPHVFTPTEIRTGTAGFISGTSEEGSDVQFPIASIDKMGAIS